MKTSLLLVTILSAATLAACSAKIDSGDAGGFDLPAAQKTESPEVQELKVDTGVGTVESNTIKVYGANGNDRTFYLTYTAAETGDLVWSSASMSGFSCETSNIVAAVEFQTVGADGSVSKSVPVTYANPYMSVVKGQTYRLKIQLSGLSSCETLYYDILIQN